MIYLFGAVAAVAVGYALYKHMTLSQIEQEINNLDALVKSKANLVEADIKNFVARVKAKL